MVPWKGTGPGKKYPYPGRGTTYLLKNWEKNTFQGRGGAQKPGKICAGNKGGIVSKRARDHRNSKTVSKGDIFRKKHLKLKQKIPPR